MNEQDLRVQRTRRLLQEAFIELANEKDYSQITIRELTKRAQVGYKTFFRHYESIEALLQAIVDKFLMEFEQVTLASIDIKAFRHNTLTALQLAKENQKLFLTVFSNPLSSTFLQPVMMKVYQDSQQLLIGSKLPEALVGHHFSVSIFSLIKWWLEDGASYSKEEMVDYIQQLVIEPLELRQRNVNNDDV